MLRFGFFSAHVVAWREVLKQDRFIIRALEARCILGVYNWEREAPRPVVIDLEFSPPPPPPGHPAPRGPDEPFVDYARVAAEVKTHVEASRCRLMEELAEEVAGVCLSRFPLERIKVRLGKPGAIPGAETVILEIERSRDD